MNIRTFSSSNRRKLLCRQKKSRSRSSLGLPVRIIAGIVLIFATNCSVIIQFCLAFRPVASPFGAATLARQISRIQCGAAPFTLTHVSASPISSSRRTSMRLRAATTNCSMDNPLLQSWNDMPFHLPPFQKIRPSHFSPAFSKAMSSHLRDLDDIVNDPRDPTFDTVMIPYDRAGGLLDRVGSVFGNYCGSLNSPDMQSVQSEMAPVLSRHTSSTYTLPGLFEKIDAVHQNRHNSENSHLTKEEVRLIERVWMDFTRQGARFNDAVKEEYADIMAEMSSLQTQFQQNVMKDEETYEMVLSLEEMAGCPDSLIDAARQAAAEREKDDEYYVITLSRSLVEPFLTYSDRRDLREQVCRAWMKRGELSADRDNSVLAVQLLKLRKRIAELHGCSSFAEFQCLDKMAKTPANVIDLLENVWARARKSANRERLALEQYVESTGEVLDGGIEFWDWRYYAEKVRKARYDLDESLIKPYFSLQSVTEAVMAVSKNLFGLRYIRRHDVEAYHPDVDVYEVRENVADTKTGKLSDKLVALFLHDNYARKHKSSGAWMSEYRTQTKNLPPNADPMEGVPIVSNNNNFAKGQPSTLLSYNDAKTLFHEMGHGHHGMLSNANFGRLASTNVLTDFVELPSQLFEHWLSQPEVLKKHAKHFETGEPISDELLQKIKAAEKFNQGFETVEYAACALFDMAVHMIEDYDDGFDLGDFEAKQMERMGMPKGIVMRHRPTHFQHLFSSSHYAAGYYVYMWAQVLDADVFAAFEESGNVFDPDVASKARQYIYSSGNTEAPDELFRSFRGRDPDIKFLLEKLGLANN